MQFYNTTDQENSLVHECWDLCDADINSYPLAKVTRRFNFALEELVALILLADGTWQYDDTNHTDLPIGTGTLVEAQQSYSFASEYLEIEIVKVKDKDGNWATLDLVDDRNFRNVPLEEYFATTGMPTHYDKEGDTIKLYPAPTATAVTLASGIKVHFKRTADLFTVSDTTQEPGLPSPFHIMLSYMAAIPYCMTYKQDRVRELERKVGSTDKRSPFYGGMKKDLIKFFSRREGDKRHILKPKRIQYI